MTEQVKFFRTSGARLLLGLAIHVSFGPGFVAPANAASDPEVASIVKRLSGVWNEVVLESPNCADRGYLHSFRIASDGLRLIKTYHRPVDALPGAPSSITFRILYAEENSLMLYQEGEEFVHRDTGDRLVRQLIIESPTKYSWRLYGRPRDFRAAGGGALCQAPSN